jgi:hypothetical protein
MLLLKKIHTHYLLLMRLLTCSRTRGLYIFRWFFGIPLDFHSTRRYKIAFVTNWGAFVWVVMPFGVKNGPPTYQKAVIKALCEYIDVFMKILFR